MLEVLGKNYYIDVNKVIEECRPNYRISKNIKGSEEQEIPEGGLELNVFKFEIIKSCIERVLNEYPSEEDDNIPVFQEKSTSLSFKIAFNTLIKNKILIENDYDE